MKREISHVFLNRSSVGLPTFTGRIVPLKYPFTIKSIVFNAKTPVSKCFAFVHALVCTCAYTQTHFTVSASSSMADTQLHNISRRRFFVNEVLLTFHKCAATFDAFQQMPARAAAAGPRRPVTQLQRW